jgi:hypothetical protein
MNLFQQHGVRDYAAAAAQIRVIDFGPLFAGEPGALPRVAAEARMPVRMSGSFMP